MDHILRCGHGRAGMIPRWKQDNGLLHQRDVAHAVKSGRRHWHTGESYDKVGKSSLTFKTSAFYVLCPKNGDMADEFTIGRLEPWTTLPI